MVLIKLPQIIFDYVHTSPLDHTFIVKHLYYSNIVHDISNIQEASYSMAIFILHYIASNIYCPTCHQTFYWSVEYSMSCEFVKYANLCLSVQMSICLSTYFKVILK